MTFRSERFHWGDDCELEWHPPVLTDAEWTEGKHPRGASAPGHSGGEFAKTEHRGEGEDEDGDGEGSTKLDPKVIHVGGDKWNRTVARKLERDYQASKPALDKLSADAVGKTVEEIAEPSDSDDEPVGEPPYEPEEWDMISSSGQSQAEEEYVKWAKDDYQQSEENYWYEEYAPHEAREKVAEEFNDATEREWAEDALADADEDVVPEMPGGFDYNQILAAITIHFEGNPGGSVKDPEFEWNDDYLNELTPEGFEVEQPEFLPGMEQPVIHPADRLTEDMRGRIEKILSKAFDKKGDSESGSLDVPEWVADNAAEQAGEGWGQMEDSDKFEWVKAHTSIIEDESTAGTGDYAEHHPSEPESEEVDALPEYYDPLNTTTGIDYRRTQKLAHYLSTERTVQVMMERKILPEISGTAKGSPEWQTAMKRTMKRIDSRLWSSWKDSSTSQNGILLQVAAAEELGGRLNVKTGSASGEQLIFPDNARNWANEHYAEIGGYKGVLAYVRAKWEVTQYLLDKAGKQELYLYRGIKLGQDKFEAARKDAQQVREEGKGSVGRSYTKLPTIMVDRNGAASTSVSNKIASDWDGDHNRVVLRAHVPRTAALSVPAYGINITSEQEVVVAGTAWKAWDAWDGRAPDFDTIPLDKRGGIGTDAPELPKAA